MDQSEIDRLANEAQYLAFELNNVPNDSALLDKHLKQAEAIKLEITTALSEANNNDEGLFVQRLQEQLEKLNAALESKKTQAASPTIPPVSNPFDEEERRQVIELREAIANKMALLQNKIANISPENDAERTIADELQAKLNNNQRILLDNQNIDLSHLWALHDNLDKPMQEIDALISSRIPISPPPPVNTYLFNEDERRQAIELREAIATKMALLQNKIDNISPENDAERTIAGELQTKLNNNQRILLDNQNIDLSHLRAFHDSLDKPMQEIDALISSRTPPTPVFNDANKKASLISAIDTQLTELSSKLKNVSSTATLTNEEEKKQLSEDRMFIDTLRRRIKHPDTTLVELQNCNVYMTKKLQTTDTWIAEVATRTPPPAPRQAHNSSLITIQAPPAANMQNSAGKEPSAAPANPVIISRLKTISETELSTKLNDAMKTQGLPEFTSVKKMGDEFHLHSQDLPVIKLHEAGTVTSTVPEASKMEAQAQKLVATYMVSLALTGQTLNQANKPEISCSNNDMKIVLETAFQKAITNQATASSCINLSPPPDTHKNTHAHGLPPQAPSPVTVRHFDDLEDEDELNDNYSI